ncbi:MAG TPA: FtsX-like permease family protein [Gemmatimonadaceae bacterium]|nr:FtsX-like permease family protein [Gemmatimonadaceae bacterium]
MLPLRAAIKSLRRSPGFATVSIVSLALALGLVAGVFGMVDALRRPRTVSLDPERLFTIVYSGDGKAGQVTAGDHVDVLQRFVRSVESTAYTGQGFMANLVSGDLVVEGRGLLTSANYFAVRGVRPIAGRLFDPATADEDAAASVVISEQLWISLFHRQPRLEKLALRIESGLGTSRRQVIGVLPAEFFNETSTDVWQVMPSDVKAYATTNRGVYPIVRLRPNATIDSLIADFKVASEYMLQVHGKGRRDFVYRAWPVMRDPLELRAMHWILVGAGFTVLIIACSNLANLILARGLTRRRDLAVRMSLGARRSDLVREVLAESVVLSLAGAALGLVAATWGFDLLRGSLPDRNPVTFGLVLTMNWRVIAMSSGAAVLSALIFGLLPALRLSDMRLSEAIKEASGSTTARKHGRFSALVIGQVALSLVLLTGVSLLLRASRITQALDLGFDARKLLYVSVSPPWRSPVDTTFAARSALAAATETRLHRFDEIQSVAWRAGGSLKYPAFTGERSGGGFRSRFLRGYTIASPNLLRTIGIPIIRGRDFEDRDLFSEGVLIVDSVTALKLWGSDDPIGKLAKFGPEERIAPWYRVIGISRTILPSMPQYAGEDAEPQIYLVSKDSVASRWFVVRAPEKVMPELRTGIAATMRDIVPPRGSIAVSGFDDARQKMIKEQLFLSRVFGAFGAMSLLLCALGMYSVLSYAVTQRMREVGIRLALGATTKRIFLDVLHDGAILIVAGTAVGGFATIWTNKFVDPFIGLLYHIDAIALLMAEAVLVSVALLAMIRPAARATKSDPVEVLRAA